MLLATSQFDGIRNQSSCVPVRLWRTAPDVGAALIHHGSGEPDGERNDDVANDSHWRGGSVTPVGLILLDHCVTVKALIAFVGDLTVASIKRFATNFIFFRRDHTEYLILR